jgi:DNA end-binding protein Ku
MVAVRAQWKGSLQFGALSVPVALYTATSTSDRTAFNMVNRSTGNRLRREFIDPTTDKAVEKEAQVKGFEIEPDNFIILEPEEVAKAVPESDKKLAIEAFIACHEVDTTYFDKPYYLLPTGPGAAESYAVIRDALIDGKMAALAHAVLFRRYRGVLIRPSGKGLIAQTLKFDYEVRSAQKAFDELADYDIKGEMLDLAKHIIKTKIGTFDPASFVDRYEAAITDLVKAKMEGRTITAPKAAKVSNVVNLMEALRASAGKAKPTSEKLGRKRAEPSRKAS